MKTHVQVQLTIKHSFIHKFFQKYSLICKIVLMLSKIAIMCFLFLVLKTAQKPYMYRMLKFCQFCRDEEGAERTRQTLERARAPAAFLRGAQEPLNVSQRFRTWLGGMEQRLRTPQPSTNGEASVAPATQ